MQVRSGPRRKRPEVLDTLREAPPRATWGRARLDRFRPSWARRARKAPEWVQDTIAVTPVIGTIMILAISVIGIAAVLTWGLPKIQQTQATTEIEGVAEQFQAFDQIADQVMRGGAVGKASEGKLNIPSGSIQRDNGTLFLVGVSPNITEFVNGERFHVTGLDDDDPQTFTIQTLDLTNRATMHVDVSQYTLTTQGPRSFYNFDQNGYAHVTLPDDVHHGATRIVIDREVSGVDHTVYEGWIFPVGSLLYERTTSFGNVEIMLENSAVITKMDTGSFVRSPPLATIERDASDRVTFFAFFPMVLTDNETYPGVQGAGAGTYPLLFGLAGNTLRLNGVDTLSLQIKAVGERGPLWMQYMTDRYDFASNLPADPSVRIDAGADGAGNLLAFDVVLMQSTVEVTLKSDTAVLQG